MHSTINRFSQMQQNSNTKSSNQDSRTRNSTSNNSSTTPSKSLERQSSSSQHTASKTTTPHSRATYHQSTDMTSFKINKQFFLEIYEQLDFCTTMLDRVQKQPLDAPYFKA